MLPQRQERRHQLGISGCQGEADGEPKRGPRVAKVLASASASREDGRMNGQGGVTGLSDANRAVA